MDLLGDIYITTDKNIVFETINMRPDVKLISLDEDNELGIDPKCFISGSILLPPVEAIIAEVDGNEQKYDFIYSSHLNSDPVKEYIACLIALSRFSVSNVIFFTRKVLCSGFSKGQYEESFRFRLC